MRTCTPSKFTLKLKTTMITEKELEKLRNQIENDFINSNSRMKGIAESLANYYIFYKTHMY